MHSSSCSGQYAMLIANGSQPGGRVIAGLGPAAVTIIRPALILQKRSFCTWNVINVFVFVVCIEPFLRAISLSP